MSDEPLKLKDMPEDVKQVVRHAEKVFHRDGELRPFLRLWHPDPNNKVADVPIAIFMDPERKHLLEALMLMSVKMGCSAFCQITEAWGVPPTKQNVELATQQRIYTAPDREECLMMVYENAQNMIQGMAKIIRPKFGRPRLTGWDFGISTAAEVREIIEQHDAETGIEAPTPRLQFIWEKANRMTAEEVAERAAPIAAYFGFLSPTARRVCPEHAKRPDPKYATMPPESFVGKHVKIAFKVNHPECSVEHLWVTVTDFSGKLLHGKINNDPVYADLKDGDQVSFTLNRIEEVLDESQL